jgi:predicted  nucleic acid-binding Zn-ribbon protein
MEGVSRRLVIEQLENLRHQMEKKKQQIDALNKVISRGTDEMYTTLSNLIIEVVTDHQLLREALEEIEKGIKHEDAGGDVLSPR